MKPAFPEINKIPYEGPSSKNPLAFKHYNASEVRTMAEQLRFSVVYWHTFRNVLSDPFGVGTAIRPWDDGSNSLENACNRARVAFEFIEKLGAPSTQVMLTVLKMGGLTTGGLNFDAKVRRESFEPIDLFYAHIGGMDAFARGLKIAAAIRSDGRLAELVKNRYASWESQH